MPPVLTLNLHSDLHSLKAYGSDVVLPILLKQCASVLITYLIKLFSSINFCQHYQFTKQGGLF